MNFKIKEDGGTVVGGRRVLTHVVNGLLMSLDRFFKLTGEAEGAAEAVIG